MTITPKDIEAIREAALACTPGDLDTVPNPPTEYGGKEEDYHECPQCGGEGAVDGVTYCNFDGVAMGVQFFGIGDEHVRYERFFRAANPPAILSLLQALTEAQERAERAEETLAEVKAGAENTIDFYNRNGPQWTSRETGQEYYSASYVIGSAEEVIALVDAAQTLKERKDV